MPQSPSSVDKKTKQPVNGSSFRRHARRAYKLALGRMVELLGNRIRVDGMVFSIDSPTIDRTQKWSLFSEEHEPHERALLNRWLPKDLPVVEFGGGIGVISCSCNRMLSKPENHIVVEANPNVVPLLERNRELNGCRFQIKHKALAYDTEIVKFSLNWNLFGGQLGDDGEKSVLVSATSLKAIADEYGFDQFSVICDIEGAEALLVERERDLLRDRVRFLLVEIHQNFIGDEATSRMIQSLLTAGFILRQQFGRNWAFNK